MIRAVKPTSGWRRTLLAYLFAPILRARFNAIREH
jgi:hypothetical protein